MLHSSNIFWNFTCAGSLRTFSWKMRYMLLHGVFAHPDLYGRSSVQNAVCVAFS